MAQNSQQQWCCDVRERTTEVSGKSAVFPVKQHPCYGGAYCRTVKSCLASVHIDDTMNQSMLDFPNSCARSLFCRRDCLFLASLIGT